MKNDRVPEVRLVMNRRTAMKLGAAAIAAAGVADPAEAVDDTALVSHHDAVLKGLLDQQVTDPASPWCGTYADDRGLYTAQSASQVLYNGAAAFCHPQSVYHQSPNVFERMKLAAQFLERSQSHDGNIDLLVTNFNSPPDTGFVVHRVGTAARIAQMNGEDALLNVIAPFLRKAGEGMVKGGIHTPNHRWVVGAALAQINELFPNPRYVARIDQWLAEGVDIDAEGQYIERSTTVYNAVSNNAFVVMAHKLNRPELLDPVRSNLDAMTYLVHPNGDVVTETSRRQDLNQRGTMERYWFALRYMAIQDNNGLYATMLAPLEPSRVTLPEWMEYPQIRAALPASKPLPDDFERIYAVAGITRIRRGKTSATILHTGNSRCFAVHHGNAVIQGIRFASAFFGKGQFIPAVFEKRGNTYYFRQELQGPYYQPLNDESLFPVTRQNWGNARNRREQTEICNMNYSVQLRETANGFDMTIGATGTPAVPIAVEISLRPGGDLNGVENGNLLKQGFATYRVGTDTIQFGPGRADHRYTQVRGAEAKLPGMSVYLTGQTPFEHTLKIELG